MKTKDWAIDALCIGMAIYLVCSPVIAARLYKRGLFGPMGPCLRQSTHHLVGKGVSVTFPGPSGAVLRGVFYGNPQSELLCVYAMGRNSNLSKGAENAEVMLHAGASVFVIEYEGFGSTPGKASMEQMQQDLLFALDYASHKLGYDLSSIVVYGESLGGHAAVQACSRRQVGGLILQSVPLSVEQAAKNMIPALRIYPRWIFPADMKNSTAQMLAQMRTNERVPPLLVIHGCKDRVVPLWHSVKNFQAITGGYKALVHLINGNHGGLAVSDREVFFEAVKGFFQLVH